MTRIHGPITRLYKKQDLGFVLAPGGWELAFHPSDLRTCSISELEPGMEVEFKMSKGRWRQVSELAPYQALRLAS